MTLNKITKKTVLLVGASSELGQSMMTELEVRGYSVIGTYHSNQVRPELRQMDVTSNASIEATIQAAINEAGTIDATIFCSAIDRPELIRYADIEGWQAVMDTNFFGAVRLTKALLPHYLANSAGIFLYISSGMATRSNIGTAAYAASKAALNALSLGLSKEHAKNGISAFTVMPGFFEGGLLKDMDEKRKSRIATLIDSKRIGNSEEIAKFCIAAMENSSYLSGSNLEINGGLA